MCWKQQNGPAYGSERLWRGPNCDWLDEWTRAFIKLPVLLGVPSLPWSVPTKSGLREHNRWTCDSHGRPRLIDMPWGRRIGGVVRSHRRAIVAQIWCPSWPLSTAKSAYNGHVSIKTGPRTNGRRWHGLLKARPRREEGKPAEAVWCLGCVLLGKPWVLPFMWI